MELVSKNTEPPAAIVTSFAGEEITLWGGVVVYGDSRMNFATEGTPALFSRNSM